MKHILIVDDDSMNLLLAKHALANNYEVTSVTSGEEALTWLENNLPDLVLLDIEMPGMSGLDVVKTMKEDSRWNKIPVIILTADSDPDMEAECLRNGADDFIIKPFVPIVMTGRVGRILELYELRKALEVQLEQKKEQIKNVTRISVTDPLTGLYNRSYMERKITEYIADNHKGTLFMMDMDNFKKVNDTFGHIVGDKTLQIFADILKENARKVDIVARLGGDEFVVFFLDMVDREAIEQKAQSIIRMFTEKFGTLQYQSDISVSIGIAHYPEDGKDFKTLYEKADKALYYIKNNGKNAYYFFDEKKEQALEVYNTEVDLNNVRDLLEGKLDAGKGVFQVAYGEFQKIYDFLLRCVARRQQSVQTVLLTIGAKAQETLAVEDVEHAMCVLQEAVKDSLRAVDVGTGYSSRQYILILMDADMENGIKVVERVIGKFYRMYEKNNITLSYDIQTMQPEME